VPRWPRYSQRGRHCAAMCSDDQGALRRHVAVYVNGRLVDDRVGLTDPVGPHDEIYVFQALSGG